MQEGYDEFIFAPNKIVYVVVLNINNELLHILLCSRIPLL